MHNTPVIDNPLSDSNLESTAVQNLPPRGPGEVLRMARNRLGLSLEHMARSLHLPIAVVSALESDDQDKLPEPAYVKGYIRSYARCLDLDSKPLIEGYVKYIQPQNQHSQSQQHKENGPTGALDWMSLGGAAVLVAFVSAWWIIDSGERRPEHDGLNSIQSEPAEMAPGTPPSISSEPRRPAEKQSAIPATAVKGSPGLDESFRNTLPTLPAVPTAVPQVNAESSAAIAAPAVNSAARTSTEPVSSAETEIQTLATADDRLQLSFNDTSWAEVYDAKERRLLYGLMSAGSIESLHGSTPFTVVLGNSPSVNIELNGETYDHTQFDRLDNSARFTLGASGAE